MATQEPRENPILKANIFSRLSFWWMNKIFIQGFKNDLEFSDIYQVLPKDKSDCLGETLGGFWKQEVEKSLRKNEKNPGRVKPYRPSLLKALFNQFKTEYMLGGMIGFFEECLLRMAQPLLLGFLIRYFNQTGEFDKLQGNLFALGVVLTAISLIYTHHAYFLKISHVGMRVRVACSSLVFRKAMKLSQSALADTSVGKFTNVFANDASRFEMAAVFAHYFWIGPIQTAIATVILWQYFGYSCLVGLLILILLVPFQGYMGKLFSKLRAQTALKTDKRIRIMNEIVNGMRVIKFYTWEKPFTALVADSRRDEIKVIRKTSTLRAINMSMFFASSKIIIFFTLLTYVLLKNPLTAEKVFVSLALYNNIRLNMTLFFPSAVSSVAEALVSIRRIEDILLMDEKEISALDKNSNDNLTTIEENKNVTMEHFTGKWNLKYEENTLTDISFTVKSKQIMVIIGHVGAGKGSIIQAILNELPAITGRVQVKGRLAYTAQEPWIFAGSIRQNIIFGEEYKSEWYEKVVEACALNRDLTLLPYGDLTLVGDRGNSLSGGQKARINLARAVYSNADIYLLDDPLSAVDAEVGRHLFDKCINGILGNKIRILVTHQLQFLKSVDHIVLMENGKIQKEGTYEELVSSGIDFAKLLESNKDGHFISSPHAVSYSSFYPTSPRNRIKASSDTSVNSVGFSLTRHESLTLGENSLLGSMYPHEEIVDPNEEELNSIKTAVSLSRTAADDKSMNDEKVEFFPKADEETKSSGSVKWSLYFKYFRAGSNYCSMFLLIISNLISQILFTGADYWLNLWTRAEEQKSKKMLTDSDPLYSLWNDFDLQVGIYSAIVAAVFITSMWRTMLFFQISLNSSINLHNSMFEGLIRAPISFFEKNPTGRILNRFTSGVGEMDDTLPPCFFDALAILLNVLATVILIGIVNPILLTAAALLAVILYFLRSFYLHTARSVKRLEGIARSPVYSHLSTTLYGLPTIRAFKAEHQLIQQFDDHLNLHSAAWYLFITSTRWFGYWLDWLSTFFIAAVTFSFMIQSGGDGSTVGLIISSVIQLSGAFQWGIRQSAEVESQMISVERVLEYTHIEPEAPLESENGKKPPDDWPSKGEIKMYDVQLQYGDATPVLQNITCVFHSSEKVGIVGRTGAGKSSLITAIFRIAEPTGEIYIDDINILKIGLHDLRAKISIIPQDPVLFMGSLRKNLDPFNSYPDSKIWDALEQVHLAADVKVVPFGLELEVTEGGANFSVGQRQLVCLARAILKQSKILILDEATANVDPETDNLIQKTIRTKFTNCTVLTIAHRLNTVMDSDRILVLDAGKIKDFGIPFILLEDKETELYHLVQETGEDSAKNLYAIAKAAMEKGHLIQEKQTSVQD